MIVKRETENLTKKDFNNAVVETSKKDPIELFKIRQEAFDNHPKEKNPFINHIPYLVIPLNLEEEINNIIKKFAVIVTNTGKESKSLPKTEGTSAIVNDSVFAQQHPNLYNKIFRHIIEHSNNVPQNQRDGLLENYDRAIEDLQKISNAFNNVIKSENQEEIAPARFCGLKPSKFSRSKSNQRLSLIAPNFELFLSFYNDPVSFKNNFPHSIEDNESNNNKTFLDRVKTASTDNNKAQNLR